MIHYTLTRDESTLTVTPVTNDVEEFLTITEKKMVVQGYQRVTVREKVPFFQVDSDDPNTALTYQGIWRSLGEYLEKQGATVTHVDKRTHFPKLRLDLASGLRYSQGRLLNEVAMANTSGLLGAVTRYGKSFVIINMCKVYPHSNIVVTAPGIDLVKQLYADITYNMPDCGREIRLICSGGGRTPAGDNGITVCSMDSLHKCDPNIVDIILIDEPHACVTNSRIPKLAEFYRSRKVGFGATLKGRYDQRDKLIEATIGPVLANVSYLEAVEEGAVAPLHVVFWKIPFRSSAVTAKTYETVMKQMLTQSKRIGDTLKMFDKVIPDAWQTLIFIRDEKQAETMETYLPEDNVIAMAKRLKPKERDIVTQKLRDNEISRCLASNIYVQGVTFPDVKVLINLASGGANTGAIQKPGRLLQNREGKNYGVMIDLMYECTDASDDMRKNPAYKRLIGESWARHAAYKEIGYDITITNDEEKLATILKGAHDEGI